jgi:hypothetical protein
MSHGLAASKEVDAIQAVRSCPGHLGTHRSWLETSSHHLNLQHSHDAICRLKQSAGRSSSCYPWIECTRTPSLEYNRLLNKLAGISGEAGFSSNPHWTHWTRHLGISQATTAVFKIISRNLELQRPTDPLDIGATSRGVSGYRGGCML